MCIIIVVRNIFLSKTLHKQRYDILCLTCIKSDLIVIFFIDGLNKIIFISFKQKMLFCHPRFSDISIQLHSVTIHQA